MEKPDPPDRPDNLSHPVEGDDEARGRFGDEAKTGSFELALSIHRDRILWTIAILILPGPLLGLILD
jgi:hypothetical protein